jgi:hypothetical protein
LGKRFPIQILFFEGGEQGHPLILYQESLEDLQKELYLGR